MRLRRHLGAFGACIAILTGCAGERNVPLSPVTPHELKSRSTSSFPNLYVDYGSGIAVYAPGSTTPIRTITKGVSNSNAMTIDSNGYVYVSSEIENTVRVYAPRRGSVLRSIVEGITQPGSIVIDKNGAVYIANCYACTGSEKGRVTIYGPGGVGLERAITKGISAPIGLAFDNEGALYVINGFPTYNVAIYPPGSQAPKKTITGFPKVEAPGSLAFDSAGNLFLGVIGAAKQDTVRIYAPSSTKPDAYIRKGIRYPGAMAFDAEGKLYLVNSSVGNSAKGEISVFSRDRKLLRNITKGLANPSGLAFDGTGRLYVENWGYSVASPSVTVYAPGGVSPIETIPLVWQPHAIAFGP